MRVAVVIPVKDGADTIGAAIRACLDQTRPPDEVIVVDNGSTDDTREAARAAGARVMSEPRSGSYAARNLGLRSTACDVVAFTDADCVPTSTWIERLLAGLAPGVDVVGGEVAAPRACSPAERWSEERGVLSQSAGWRHPFLPCFATANVAWRREALERIGGFDASLLSGGDVDACWRAQRAGCVLAFAPDAVVTHPHRRRIRDLLAQQHRYGVGHGRLDTRWARDAEYAAAQGRPAERLRSVWLLPARAARTAARRGDLAIPFLDAAVRIVREAGRVRGRRLPPLSPLHPWPSPPDPQPARP